MKKNIFLTSAAIIITNNPANIASAQNINNQPKTDVKQEIIFDEVIVTARKRKENIQQTPLSISAFTSDLIEQAGIKNMVDLAKFTPGFSLEEDFGRFAANRSVIRGQSTIYGASGVSSFVDGIYMNGSLLDYDLNDVERVEIIRGPQSALYGHNTYSGAINIITKSPSDEFSGDIKIDAGSFGRFEISSSIRGPFKNGVTSGGLTARYYRRGGVFTNIYDNSDVGQQESASLSGVIYYEPTNEFYMRARLRASSLNDDQLRNFNTPVEMNNIYRDTGPVYLGNYRYFQGEIITRPINVDDVRLLDEKGFDKATNLEASLIASKKFTDNFTLELLNGINWEGSRSKYEFGNTPQSLNPFFLSLGPAFGPTSNVYIISGPVADFALDSKAETLDYSGEIHLKYNTAKWSGLLGGYIFYGDNDNEQMRQAPNAFAEIVEEGWSRQDGFGRAICAARGITSPNPCFFNVNLGDDLEDLQYFADRSLASTSRKNLAVFASVNFDITEKLNLSLEGRYASETIKSRQTKRSQVYDYLGNPLRFEADNEVRRSADFTSFNPRISAKYAYSDNTNFYALIAKGNKPGGFNGINVADQGFGKYDE